MISGVVVMIVDAEVANGWNSYLLSKDARVDGLVGSSGSGDLCFVIFLGRTLPVYSSLDNQTVIQLNLVVII